MKTHFSISIPKPCQEDWSKMTPNDKGRFCQSCSKPVIDFTQMPQQEIQDYLAINTSKKICGRFKASQLKQIRIEIPQHIIQQQTSFQKLFLLALLIAMGTSLLNCSDKNGNTKKIDAVEVISTLKAKAIQTPEITTSKIIIDSSKTIIIPKPKAPTTVNQPPIPHIMGDVVEVIDVIGLIEPLQIDDNDFIGFINIETAPEFLDTPSTITKSGKKDYFSKRITQFVGNNYDLGQGDLGFEGKQRIQTQFTIDNYGNVSNIKIRTPHQQLEEEARRVLKLLPKFKPGEQRNGKVSVVYTLPIVIFIED